VSLLAACKTLDLFNCEELFEHRAAACACSFLRSMPYRCRIAPLLSLLGCAAAFSSLARPPTRRVSRPGPPSMTAEMSATDARTFCSTSPHAVIVTVWPTAHAQAAAARRWVLDCGGQILHDAEVAIGKQGSVATCLALYSGEDWLETNCWYGESPLPTGPPDGPHAGARWKAALTWTQDAPLTVFVVDASETGGALWSSKYRVREQLRREVGGLGNCCVHLTDDQTAALDGRGARGAGYACDSSYAYHCARVLLDASSVRFLAEADADAPAFEERFAAYESWLAREDAPVGGAPAFFV
jgi:hypothetical protein